MSKVHIWIYDDGDHTMCGRHIEKVIKVKAISKEDHGDPGVLEDIILTFEDDLCESCRRRY